MLYERLFRPLLFQLDPETAHGCVLALLRCLGTCQTLSPILRHFTSIDDPRLAQDVFHLRFPNPIGLAAGFDKNAGGLLGLSALGFGFIEAGTVTQHAQKGNPRPRMFRYPHDRAIINRMGFNNDGADTVAATLTRSRPLPIPLGISLGKSKKTPLEIADDDYAYSLETLYAHGDYFVVNVSSPNTPGLRDLQEKVHLRILIGRLMDDINLRVSERKERKPLLVKIGPDLSLKAIDDVLEICMERVVDGIIATNTTIARRGLTVSPNEAGGLSGPPLFERACEIVRYIFTRTGGRIPIIGVGGISSADDAYAMLKAGASLIQIYTSLVYKGPCIVRKINRGLLALMERDGITHLSALRGQEA